MGRGWRGQTRLRLGLESHFTRPFWYLITARDGATFGGTGKMGVQASPGFRIGVEKGLDQSPTWPRFAGIERERFKQGVTFGGARRKA